MKNVVIIILINFLLISCASYEYYLQNEFECVEGCGVSKDGLIKVNILDFDNYTGYVTVEIENLSDDIIFICDSLSTVNFNDELVANPVIVPKSMEYIKNPVLSDKCKVKLHLYNHLKPLFSYVKSKHTSYYGSGYKYKINSVKKDLSNYLDSEIRFSIIYKRLNDTKWSFHNATARITELYIAKYKN